MRTTVTLDPDVRRLLEEAQARAKRPFKQVLNDAVRAGLGRPVVRTAAFKQPVFSLGRAKVDLTKAASLAGDLDDTGTLAKAGAASTPQRRR